MWDNNNYILRLNLQECWMKFLNRAAFCALLVVSLTSRAQGYPERPVRVIIPLSAGSLTDTLLRLMATKMSAILGSSVVIENLPGAGGIVGAVAAAKAPPDGYTIAVAAASAFSVNPHVHKQLPYNPVKDFAPVCRIGGAPYVLAVHPSLGVKSLPEFLERARSKPLAFASAGAGTPTHLAQEMLKARVGIPFLHVPYKGTSQSVADTVGGHAQVVFETPGPLLGFVQSGQLIPLAVTSTRRTASLPNVPTFEELGISGLQLQGWIALVAPAGTPPAIVNRLAEACQAGVNAPEVQAQGRVGGLDFDYGGPAVLATFIATELPKWGKLVTMAGIKPE
jgi:tripartite-type tricarboxylate transporter receptor subunit TctC